MEFSNIASAAGYESVFVAEEKESLAQGLVQLVGTSGPYLLEIRVACNSRSDLGRPITTPLENKRALMDFMSRKS